jgi:hypothetical protein
MDYGEIVLAERVGKGSYGEVRFLYNPPLQSTTDIIASGLISSGCCHKTQVFKGIWRGTEVAVKKLPYYFEQLEDKEQQKTFLEGFIQETQLMKCRLHPTPTLHSLPKVLSWPLR